MPTGSRSKRLAALVGALILSAVSILRFDGANASEAFNPILVSATSDRRSAAPLEGQQIDGSVYVFLGGLPAVAEVRWHFDNAPDGTPNRIETTWPFDMMGTAASGMAEPMKTQNWRVGKHVVWAVVRHTNKTEETYRAHYTVSPSHGSTTTTFTTTTQAPVDSTTPFARGIMSQGLPARGHRYIDYAVGGTNILWKDLETSDQVFTGPAWARIDSVLANPQIKGVRLRVYAGRQAPAFVKALGGPGVSGNGYDCSAGGIAVHNAFDGKGGCVPYFWKDVYLRQYGELLTELERRYGTNSKFVEIVNSACSTTYAEPFYRAHRHAESNARLFAAGLNRSTDIYCHERAMSLHQSKLPNQSISLAINVWEFVVSPAAGKPANLSPDWTEGRLFADKWRRVLGERLILQNNGWGETDDCAGDDANANVYCYLEMSVDTLKGYQSETWGRLGETPGTSSVQGWYMILENAIDAGACFVESTDNGYQNADPRIAAEYDRRLEANCR